MEMKTSDGFVIPTDDATVRNQLRGLNQPMILYGETPKQRRERLRKLLTILSPLERESLLPPAIKPIEDEGDNEIFYYEGCEGLRQARINIAYYSLKQASFRLDMARFKQLEPISTRMMAHQSVIEKVRQMEVLGMYVDDDVSTTELKTLTSCSLNQDATLLASSSRSGRCKLWSVPDMETTMNFRGHESYANFITFSPKSDLTPESANLASCAMDGSLYLWNLVDEKPYHQISGPEKWTTSRVRYHPCGDYLATCCSDNSWRLWDLESNIEILHQVGHSEAVFDLDFHPDGSLAGSAGLDTFARVWDLRTGRSIQLLEGHTGGIRSISFSPDGYHLATGSMDNTVKIWNLRKRQLEYTIPAHVKTVTTVLFERKNGHFLATSSLDGTVKFWSNETWAPIKTLDSLKDRVANFDLRSDYVASCHSKSIELWSMSSQ